MTTVEELQKVLFPGEPAEWDGKWGKKSQAALDAVLHPVVQAIVRTGNPVTARSERAIATLLPPVQEKARQLIAICADEEIYIQITSGTRTYAEQDALFAQGNVTKARGGYSNHNFGLAFDVTIDANPDETLQPVWESPKYKRIGYLGKSIGLAWGGDWTSIQDEPHFELRPDWAADLSESAMITELRRRKSVGQSLI